MPLFFSGLELSGVLSVQLPLKDDRVLYLIALHSAKSNKM